LLQVLNPWVEQSDSEGLASREKNLKVSREVARYQIQMELEVHSSLAVFKFLELLRLTWVEVEELDLVQHLLKLYLRLILQCQCCH